MLLCVQIPEKIILFCPSFSTAWTPPQNLSSYNKRDSEINLLGMLSVLKQEEELPCYLAILNRLYTKNHMKIEKKK